MGKEGKKNKEKQKIKAIIFDVNGVLALDTQRAHPLGHSYSKSFHKLMAASLKIDIDKWIDSIDTPYAKSIEGKISEKETINSISKNLNVKPKKLEKTIIKNYKKLFNQNKELYGYAFKLKNRGYRIAILSDQWHFSKKAIINDRLIKKFDVSIISCDVGVRKPEEDIYRMTLKKLKIKPSESIFVDNREWNLKPAEKLGIKTVLFKNNRQAIRDIEKFLK